VFAADSCILASSMEENAIAGTASGQGVWLPRIAIAASFVLGTGWSSVELEID